MKNNSILARARYSLQGIGLLLRTERSFRAHAILSSLLLVGGFAAGLRDTWLAIIILAIAIGLASEAFNAAIERICDRLWPDHSADVGAIKDIASAAAFISNVAIAIAALIFLRQAAHNWI